MKAAEVKALFPTEAALCQAFAADMEQLGGWEFYPETAGFDMLFVYKATGHQLGVEAKLALNAKVADQILPHHYYGGSDGPDFRAVVVPYVGDASEGIAKMLGILGVMVWAPHDYRNDGKPSFEYALNPSGSRHSHRMYDTTQELHSWDMAWHDWNPAKRCTLPEFVPMVACGVPSPTRLTPWKVGALRVLADLQLDGFVTAKSVRECGVDARRFCASDGWLTSLGGGRWARGAIPAFDAQHPEAFAEILVQAKDAREKALA